MATASVPKTCGKCHEGIERRFQAGVHGQALAKGDGRAPACDTCHAAHAVQRADTEAWQPPGKTSVRRTQIAGAAGLTIGLGLFVLIVYAVAHR